MPIAKSLGEFFEQVKSAETGKFNFSTYFRSITETYGTAEISLISCALLVHDHPELWCEYYPAQPLPVPRWILKGKMQPPTT